MNKQILKKYQIPTPRYTSYPTVPYWDGGVPDTKTWLTEIGLQVATEQPLGLYIHLPFCENLCTYCGCHKRITKNHGVESPYIDSLVREWELYKKHFPKPAMIQSIHLGGGTPTFFSPKNLELFIKKIIRNQEITTDAEMSFEAHPSDTTLLHLESMHKVGFRRISIGIQEFSPIILNAINRKQTTEQVIAVTHNARTIGYESINFDLIYGLPFQTIEDIHLMMDKVELLKPDRITFYGYAHVPWIKPSQRAYSVTDLPIGMSRWNLFVQGRKRLVDMGYVQIGMDHFALKEDTLTIAAKAGKLHRNFMGYTNQSSRTLIGLGISAISDNSNQFVQNEKDLMRYQQQIQNGNLPLVKGHRLTAEDRILRKHITDIMCHYKTNWATSDLIAPTINSGINRLYEMEKEGLIRFKANGLRVTSKGKPFIRNIAMMLDARYWRRKSNEQQQFSKAL